MSFILRLQGKAELPESLEIGHNYYVSLEGSIISKTESDNDDGTLNTTFAFKPVKIELLDPKGKTLKLKDPRSNSSKLRSYLWKVAQDEAPLENFDDLYDNATIEIMSMAHHIIREAVKRMKHD